MLEIDERLIEPEGEANITEDFNRVCKMIDDGDASEAIEALQEAIEALQEAVEALQEAVESLDERVTALEGGEEEEAEE